MGLLKNIKDLFQGNYLHTSEVANSYDADFDEVKKKLDSLVEKEVLRKISKNRYGVHPDIEDPHTLQKEFNKEFKELREKIREEYPKVEVTTNF